jgi:carboxypeptidase Q
LFMRRYLLPALLLTCGLPALAQEHEKDSTVLHQLAHEVLTNSKAYSHLKELTSQVGGRLAGSPGMVKAEAWGLKTLKATGADTVYLQQCMVPHWVRGAKEEVRIVSKHRDYVPPLAALALGNSVATPENGITAPIIEIADFADLDAKKDKIKGKIVFYNYHFKQDFIRTFKAYGDAVKYRAIGPSLAAKYGAVAVVIRSMSEGANNYPHTGGTNYIDSLPKIPAAALGLEDADLLSNRLKGEPDLKLYIHTSCKMLADTIGHNVIAEVRGSEHPEEIITVGGHLDSWDVNEGASDDGTGIVQSIEVLRTLNALHMRPKRTLRIVLFANEENGTRGGLKYAAAAKAAGEHHIFALESDAGGFTPRGFSLAVSLAQRAKIQSWAGLFLPYDVYSFESEGGGTDVEQLTDALGTPVGELMPDSQRYFDLHHAPNDVFSQVNKRELELGAFSMTALIYLIDKYGL